MSSASDRYRDSYLGDYGFESVLVGYRRRQVLERLALRQPRVVLEIGCGPELLYQHYREHNGDADAWLVVEPVREWCEQARGAGLPGLRVAEGYFEQVGAQAAAGLPHAPDVVVCSSVLQQVADPAAFLAAIRSTMSASSLLHVNVANERSLHRRLAVAMGLIPATGSLSDRNLSGQQCRNYDPSSLALEVERAGFRVVASGGHSVKPFTHAQMEEIQPSLGPAVIEGLYALGVADPALACEIYVEAVPA